MISLILSVALAAQSPQSDVDTYCAAIGETARMFMKHRQREVALSDVLKTLDRVDAKRRDLFRKIVFDAYSLPAWASEDMRQRATDEFGNKWELDCHQSKLGQ